MAAVGVMPFPVRDSFDSHLPTTPFIRSQAQSSHRIDPAMSQPPGANTSLDRTAAVDNLESAEHNPRMSLPSISNLLGIADGSRPASSYGVPDRKRGAGYDQTSSQSNRQEHVQGYQQGFGVNTSSNNSFATQDRMHHQLNALPRTRNTTHIDVEKSAISSGSVNVTEMNCQCPEVDTKHHPLSSQADDTSAYPAKVYSSTSNAVSDAFLYSPNASTRRQGGLHGTQGSRPGYPQARSHSGSNVAATNPWEHHHYISSSAQSGMYPPLPERYMCQTCNKAFSRPSSLKIHSHSHTGEKPFKCPHIGCGKAFSVKSNMKRHEKGCHGSIDEAVPGAYAGDEALGQG